MRNVLVVGILALTLQTASAAEPDAASLAKSYEPGVLPLIVKYCHACHSGDRTEAEIDLGPFATYSEVRKASKLWQKIGEMLDSGQMPPKDAHQPTDAERTKLKQWVRGHLTIEAKAHAGDPGKVVLRRLNNAEFTNTLRDLTNVTSLDPAKEFPVDGAAGEGFTNTGNALVMSPALVTKYLDAAKEVANHAVLLPDGFRFSPDTTRSDWTNEALAQIRALYRDHTDGGGASQVNLQGIVFDTNSGGRLAVEKYLAAALTEREALTAGTKSIAAVAKEHGLNAKYLGILWNTLNNRNANVNEIPSLLLDVIRARWRSAKPGDAVALAAEIGVWQKALWRFTSVGHIGKLNGPKAWQEAVLPLAARQDVRMKIPVAADQKEVTLYLVASDAGDGRDQDFVVWERPRLVAAGRADLLLRDVRDVSRELANRREKTFASVAQCLAAAAEADAAKEPPVLTALANKHGVDADILAAWLDHLGIGTGSAVKIDSHFKEKFTSSAGYDFVKGWGPGSTPNIAANSSDQHVRIPGNMKPHSVVMHPAPTLNVVAGWRSPIAATMRIEARVQHAHPECGNGVTWSLELRRGNTRQRLATGIAHGAKEISVGPFENVIIKPGDFISFVIGPRDGNHSCDLTSVDVTMKEIVSAANEKPREWNLARDVSPDVLAGNPHADSFGNEGVWHFYTEPVTGDVGTAIPAESLLAKWRAATDSIAKQQLATDLQKLLASSPPQDKDAPDAALHRQLTSLAGPLFTNIRKKDPASRPVQDVQTSSNIGLDPTLFGKHPNGSVIDLASVCVQAPNVIEVRLPADLIEGCELVTSGFLHRETGSEGSVQLQVTTTKPTSATGLIPTAVTESNAGGAWTSNNQRTSHAAPVIVNDGSAARQRIEVAFEAFRNVFPAALCYTKIVPVDEVVTLTLFYREDDHLKRLLLDEAQARRLDRLWDELRFVSRDALTLVDAFTQLMEFATQDADPKVFEPLRKPINDRAAAFKQLLIDSEPKHLAALLDFAGRAFRRPLTEAEAKELQSLYARLRQQELPHVEAFRLTLARVLVAPAFLYRIEKPGPGAVQGPVTDWELASRLSYFLWSSQPDDELRRVAASGTLRQPEVLRQQTLRMLSDTKTRRLATEFACQWLHIYNFDRLDEKSEKHFPTFASLRGAMYEESIQFFTDLFQNNGSVLDLLDADHTFLNEDLAKHYGIADVKGAEWRRVNGVKKFARGGILGQATTLATQAGASRTSPILRGNWISEVLLGERLPRPPKGVPQLPDDEAATAGLTVRQLVEKHSSDPKCAVCHQRIDPFGFSLEAFDAIGRRRDKDLGDRPIETKVKTMEGAEFEGLDGLRNHLLTTRRDAFVRQFCKKLLGYALGRSVQLSDEPLLTQMQTDLKSNDYKVLVALESIIHSRQFREIRGRETATED